MGFGVLFKYSKQIKTVKTVQIPLDKQPMWLIQYVNSSYNELASCSTALLKQLSDAQVVNKLRLLWNPKVHYSVHKKLALILATDQMNPVYISQSTGHWFSTCLVQRKPYTHANHANPHPTVISSRAAQI
jgi:hypothetical protein